MKVSTIWNPTKNNKKRKTFLFVHGWALEEKKVEYRFSKTTTETPRKGKVRKMVRKPKKQNKNKTIPRTDPTKIERKMGT